MLGRKCDLKAYVQNLGYSLRLQKKHLFRRFRNLTTNLTASIFEMKHRQSGKCVDNHKEPDASRQKDMNFGPQMASNWSCILPTLRKFCIPLRCQDSHTEVSKRNSTKLCQTADSKSCKQTAVDTLGASLPTKSEVKQLLGAYISSTISRLHGEYLWSETRHGQSDKGVGKHEASPTSSENFMNFG